MRIRCRAFGCKVNQIEAEELLALCLEQGHLAAPPEKPADLVILASCTVTAAADRDLRRAVRRAAREEPRLGIAVVGCLPQSRPEPLELPGLVAWLGTGARWRLPELLGELTPGRILTLAGVPEPPDRLPAGPVGLQRSRGFVAVQTGCDADCAYCVVPRVRGRERSRPAAGVVRQVEALVAAGKREIVLCGTHLGRWGRDLDGAGRLIDLLARLLELGPGFRLRLSSLEAPEVTPGLLDLVTREPRICRHLHIPLQSGSDTVLRRMRRAGGVRAYRDLVQKIATRLDRPGLGADVLVGFPGETSAEFRETLELVRSLPLTYLHVFAFSPRPGTPAADMAGGVPHAEIKARSRALRELARTKGYAFLRDLLGLREEACVIGRSPAGTLEGLTGRYVPVTLEAADPDQGELVTGELAGDPPDLTLRIDGPSDSAERTQGPATP